MTVPGSIRVSKVDKTSSGAVTLALGGDCLADIDLLRGEPGLYGGVAFTRPGRLSNTASRGPVNRCRSCCARVTPGQGLGQKGPDPHRRRRADRSRASGKFLDRRAVAAGGRLQPAGQREAAGVRRGCRPRRQVPLPQRAGGAPSAGGGAGAQRGHQGDGTGRGATRTTAGVDAPGQPERV